MTAKNPFAPDMVAEAAPPFTRKRCGEHYVWADDLEVAHRVATENGLRFLLVYHDYQVAWLKGDDVCLCIYPHKSTAGHHHLRVRDQGSKNKERARQLARALDGAKGGWCTFSAHMGAFR